MPSWTSEDWKQWLRDATTQLCSINNRNTAVLQPLVGPRISPGYRRAHSDTQALGANRIQYVTDSHIIPLPYIQYLLSLAPDTTDNHVGTSLIPRWYPHHYENRERYLITNPHQDYTPRIRGHFSSPIETDTLAGLIFTKRDNGAKLYEYPILPPAVEATVVGEMTRSGVQEYDFDSVHPGSGKGRRAKRTKQGKVMAPGTIRAIVHVERMDGDEVDRDSGYGSGSGSGSEEERGKRMTTGERKVLDAVVYHPQGDRHALVPARRMPMDKTGRRIVERMRKGMTKTKTFAAYGTPRFWGGFDD